MENRTANFSSVQSRWSEGDPVEALRPGCWKSPESKLLGLEHGGIYLMCIQVLRCSPTASGSLPSRSKALLIHLGIREDLMEGKNTFSLFCGRLLSILTWDCSKVLLTSQTDFFHCRASHSSCFGPNICSACTSIQHPSASLHVLTRCLEGITSPYWTLNGDLRSTVAASTLPEITGLTLLV